MNRYIVADLHPFYWRCSLNYQRKCLRRQKNKMIKERCSYQRKIDKLNEQIESLGLKMDENWRIYTEYNILYSFEKLANRILKHCEVLDPEKYYTQEQWVDYICFYTNDFDYEALLKEKFEKHFGPVHVKNDFTGRRFFGIFKIRMKKYYRHYLMPCEFEKILKSHHYNLDIVLF